MIRVMAAVLAILFIAFLWWVTTRGGRPGTIPGRLVAWLVAIIIFLVAMAIAAPTVASNIFVGFAHGIAAAVEGIARFLRLL